VTRGGLLQQLAKWVLESAVEGGITDYLGHERRDLAGVGSGTSAMASVPRPCRPRSAFSSSLLIFRASD
jgi:hypothetical protein